MCSDSRVASLHASLVLLGPIFVYTVNFGWNFLLYLFQINKCVLHYVRLVLKKKKQTVLE